MNIVGLQRVTYGVADLEAGARFWRDFGLVPRPTVDGARVFATAEGAEVVLRLVDDPNLPSAPVPGPTVREVTWAVGDDAALRAIAERLPSEHRRTSDATTVRATDPAGHAIAFERARLTPVQITPTPFNSPGHAQRIDRQAPLYTQAPPVHIAHLVFPL